MLYRFKDSLKEKICSGIIYRCTFSKCKVTDYGETFRHQESTLKRFSSLQYLTIYCNVIAR